MKSQLFVAVLVVGLVMSGGSQQCLLEYDHSGQLGIPSHRRQR